ncbi:hypothetical protein BDN72DRAFT_834836 [Pluteus cervinus]|uniref:Uncharacterized protein n=1 Tax=Pluteus cervinus TaxID=181527 RepID=A0ACD3B702_9AGAR|nr:hypothetical protein BDN72DRAFT_834836 [Pluteus cervinus]
MANQYKIKFDGKWTKGQLYLLKIETKMGLLEDMLNNHKRDSKTLNELRGLDLSGLLGIAKWRANEFYLRNVIPHILAFLIDGVSEQVMTIHHNVTLNEPFGRVVIPLCLVDHTLKDPIYNVVVYQGRHRDAEPDCIRGALTVAYHNFKHARGLNVQTVIGVHLDDRGWPIIHKIRVTRGYINRLAQWVVDSCRSPEPLIISCASGRTREDLEAIEKSKLGTGFIGSLSDIDFEGIWVPSTFESDEETRDKALQALAGLRCFLDPFACKEGPCDRCQRVQPIN